MQELCHRPILTSVATTHSLTGTDIANSKNHAKLSVAQARPPWHEERVTGGPGVRVSNNDSLSQSRTSLETYEIFKITLLKIHVVTLEFDFHSLSCYPSS